MVIPHDKRQIREEIKSNFVKNECEIIRFT